jgi:cell division protein FtsI/penicillin-binding protein 2
MYLPRLNNNQVLSTFRINVLWGVIFLLGLLLLGKLFYLQIIKHDYYLQLGLEQRAIAKDVLPERGRIFSLASAASQELYPLAVNKVYYEINVDPSKITRPQNVTDIFTAVLDVDKDIILAKVKESNKTYEMIAREVPFEKAEQIKQKLEELRIDINKTADPQKSVGSLEALGVNFVKTVLRYYPDNELEAHLLGFLGYGQDGYSRVGKYGLEAYWQNDLAGLTGQIVGEKDATGRLLADNNGQAVKNGADLTLTIDRAVQYFACQALERGVARYGAQTGTLIIMETSTGAIRALCNYPSFNPNEYSKVTNTDVYNNLAVYEAYEPGSVMKAVSMAIAIDQGKVTPSTLHDDKGEIRFAGGQVIKNAGQRIYGLVDMKEVLAASINTGIVQATADINNKIFEDYMKKFGFGQTVGVELSQEGIGDISSLAKKGDIYKATASFGQGITVTSLQMINALNALANRGKLLQPYVVSKIEYTDGRVEIFGPKVIRQVVTTATAAQLSAMMINVIDSGYSQKAGVAGYYVAGKSGTAEVADPQTGKYDPTKTIHSFIGFAPNDDPQFTMLVKLDYPTAATYSSDTAVPLFGEIAKFLLEYYKIPPTR